MPFLARRVVIAALAVVCFSAAAPAAPEGQETIEARVQDLDGSFVKNEAGQIVELDLASTWITDADLAKVASLTELRKINLAHAKINDIAFQYLKPLKHVTWLNCFYCEYLTDGAIAYLKEWENLEYLNVRGSEVTSRMFEHIANMKNLRVLDVGFSRVNDNDFEHLASLEKLEELHIGGNKMNGLALPLLRMLPSLKHLDVNGSQRTDSGRWGLTLSDVNIDNLTALTHLETLNMGGAQVTDAGMNQIEALTNLRALDLSLMEITAEGLAPVAKLPHLRRLNLWKSQRIDDEASAYLLKMENLQELDLGETAITDAALDRLKGLKSLKELFIGGTDATEQAVEAFRKARPDCRVTWWEKQEEVQSQEDTRLIG
jgi:Leucine-rich repeat (LRR) protein